MEQVWPADGDVLICLSVRSGFDLLLGAFGLPPQSEVLISAITIPHMVRIVKEHDLVPVPLDLDLKDPAPRVDVLSPRAVTPATRVIVVAHLFGGRVSLESVLELA